MFNYLGLNQQLAFDKVPILERTEAQKMKKTFDQTDDEVLEKDIERLSCLKFGDSVSLIRF